MQTQNFSTMFKDIQNTYRKVLEYHRNNMLDKLTLKEIKLTNSKLQKLLSDFDQVQRLNLDGAELFNYQEKFVAIQKVFQNAKTVKTTKNQFSKNIAKILDLNSNDQTPNPPVTTSPQKKSQVPQLPKKVPAPQYNNPTEISDKPVQENNLDPPESSQPYTFINQNQPLLKYQGQILSKQQENMYRQRLNRMQVNKYDNQISFKKQFENFDSGIIKAKKKKYASTISQGTNLISQKQQIISKLLYQNEQLREKLKNQVIQYQQIIQSKQQNPFLKKQPLSEISVQKFKQTEQNKYSFNLKQEPVQNTIPNKVYYNKEVQFIKKDDLHDVQKYQVYNQLLKKQNQEIYSRLHELEQVMEQLAKQNMKLKQFEKSGVTPTRYLVTNKIVSQKFNNQLSQVSFNINQKSFQQMNLLQKNQIHNQYILPRQTNNIMKITPKSSVNNDQRLSNHSKSEKYKLSNLIQSRQGENPYIKLKNILPQDNQNKYSDSVSQFQNSFDTFKVVNSINQSQISIQQSPKKHYENQKIQKQINLQNTNKTILTRNKVAFFKNSLVLIKDDPDYEIAFKRSALNKDIDTCRFIFYVNNKTLNPEKVQINYQYNNQEFSINPTQKLNTIKGKSQSRQQIIVYYKDNKNNSPMNFIICHFIFRQVTYDIILPLIFLEFKQGIFQINNIDTKTIIISPDKQFSSPHLMNTFIPLVNINEDQNLEFLKGQKPYRSETIVNTRRGIQGLRLQWQSNTLKITGDVKWVDALAWILSQIKL